MKRYLVIIFLICFLFANIFQIHTESQAETKSGYLVLCENQKYADLLKPFVEIKSQEFETRVEIWNDEKTPENIRNYLRKLKIGEPEAKPSIQPIWPELKYVLFVGNFPMGKMLKNSHMNPAYFGDRNEQYTDYYYCLLKDKVPDYADAKVKYFFEAEADIYVGRLPIINKKIVDNLVQSQNTIIYNPKLLFGLPMIAFPWEETGKKKRSGADWSLTGEFAIQQFEQKFVQVKKLYEQEGTLHSPYLTESLSFNESFNGYWGDSDFEVVFSSMDRNSGDIQGKVAMFVRTVWTDLNKDGVYMKQNQKQTNEIQTDIFEYNKFVILNKKYGRIFISGLPCDFTVETNPKDEIANTILSNFVVSVVRPGSFWIDESFSIEQGWHSTIVYLLILQNLNKSIGENIFSIAHEYSLLKNYKKYGIPDSWEAWSCSSFAILGDPSYSFFEHFKPYSIQVPEQIDMKYQTKAEIPIVNLSDQTKKIHLFTQNKWLKIMEPDIVLQPRTEKEIEIQTQIEYLVEYPGSFQPLRIPINKYGEITVETKNEKPQKIKVMAKM